MEVSWWDELSKNLVLFFAPFVALIGEYPTKLHLRWCLTVEDIIIFAVAPISVITTVVSAIRVRGSPSLREFVGRAQERASIAEAELCSSVSRDVSELYANGGIVRVPARPDPKLLEIIHDPQVPYREFYSRLGTEATAGIYPLSEYLKTERGEKNWSIQESQWFGGKKPGRPNQTTGRTSSTESKPPADTEKQQGAPQEPTSVSKPNLSRNIGVRSSRKIVTIAVCGVMVQLCILVWAALARYYLQWVRNSREDAYAVPLAVIGTVFLCSGVALCAHLIKTKAKEQVYEKTVSDDSKGRSTLYWVQAGEQTLGEQKFDPFGYCDAGSSVQKYTTSWKDNGEDPSAEWWLWLAIITSVAGFICQFFALKACHSSVAVAQLTLTAAMSLIRLILGPQRLRKEDSFMVDNPDLFQGHELDCLALKLAESETKTTCSTEGRKWVPFSSPKLDNARPDETTSGVLEKLPGDQSILVGFQVARPSETTIPMIEHELLEWTHSASCGCAESTEHCKRTPNLAEKVFFYRSRLARLTGIERPESEDSRDWGEKHVAVRNTALALAEAIEKTMEIFVRNPSLNFGKRKRWDDACALFWTIGCSLLGSRSEECQTGIIHMSLRRKTNQKGEPVDPWKVEKSDIEAALSLWVWALKELQKGQDAQKDNECISHILALSTEEMVTNQISNREWDRWMTKVDTWECQLKIKHSKEPGSASESEEATNYAQIQNGVWWKEDNDFVTNREGSAPNGPHDRRRFFGWHNIGEILSCPKVVLLDQAPKKRSAHELELELERNCAQEIYCMFATAYMQAFDNPSLQNHMEKIKKILIKDGTGICDKVDVLKCLIPFMRKETGALGRIISSKLKKHHPPANSP